MNTAVIIHTCDKYSWTWPILFSCLSKHWDYSLPIYFANEELDHDCPAKQIKTGKGGWSKRLILALSKIPEQNIIYLQEDFWTTKIDMSMLNAAIDIHKNYNADITKLGTNYEFTVNRFGSIGKYPINKQTSDSLYVMSHQPIAIFKKGYLYQCLLRRPNDEGPSEFELGITDDINKGKLYTNAICVGPLCKPNRSLIWTIEHGIRKGELIPEARRFLERQNYETFIPAGW